VSKRAAVGILLVPALVVGLGLLWNGEQVVNFILGPVDDPRYFCDAPQPSPVADLGSSTVLQECSAGKTVPIGRGKTIAVDLQSGGVDMVPNWHDFHVSDESVLQTVVAARADTSAHRRDEIAVYRAVRTGQSTISAVQVVSGWNGSTGRSHVWRVTVVVS
jgi:hypothetical protein